MVFNLLSGVTPKILPGHTNTLPNNLHGLPLLSYRLLTAEIPFSEAEFFVFAVR